MRQTEHQSQSGQLSQQALQIDFHDFVQLAGWLSDVELAQAFDLGRSDVRKLRRKLQRN